MCFSKVLLKDRIARRSSDHSDKLWGGQSGPLAALGSGQDATSTAALSDCNFCNAIFWNVIFHQAFILQEIHCCANQCTLTV